MVKALAACLVTAGIAACKAPHAPPHPVEQAPIGVVSAAPVPTAPAPVTHGSATTTPASDAPDPGCAVPTQCASTGTMGVFSIALERTACFGKCPTYRVTIDSRGNVKWEGFDWVDVPGVQTVFGDAKKARELAELVVMSCFFDMKDEYGGTVTDKAWANTTVSIGNRTKTVRHYLGDTESEGARTDGVCSAPSALTRIEQKIDEAANTARWVGTGGKAKNGVVSPP